MNISLNLKEILNNIITTCNEYRKQIFIFLLVIFISISINTYVKSINKNDPVSHKSYSKINLKSDINILDCKLTQRICYYNNITNTLELAIENCKEIDFCDSLK
jgi:hypothetical protein